MKRWPLILAALLCLAAADDPSHSLPNSAQEGRARSLFRETRCLVCQGESIDESDAPLAADLRQVIRRQVSNGASDSQIRTFLVARYGDFVLFRPRLIWINVLLWLGPFLVALCGLCWLVLRERNAPSTDLDLSPGEEAKLATLGPTTDTLAPELRSKNAAGLTER